MSGAKVQRKESVVDGLFEGPRPWSQHDYAVIAELTEEESKRETPAESESAAANECDKPRTLDPEAREVVERILRRRRRSE